MLNHNTKLLAIKDKPYSDEDSSSLVPQQTPKTSPIISIINNDFINSKPTILPFYRALLTSNNKINDLYALGYLLCKINDHYAEKSNIKFLAIEDKAYEDEECRLSESPSTLSTASTGTQSPLSISPNIFNEPTSSDQIIDDIYSDTEQLASKLHDIYHSSTTNYIEQFVEMGQLLSKLNDSYVTNANSGITDIAALEAALEYISNTYSDYLPLYKQLLNDLLTAAKNNEDFYTFSVLVNKIPNETILSHVEDVINFFEYGRQLPLLRVHKKFNSMLTNTEELLNYQKELYALYLSDRNDINYAGYLLVRSVLLNNYLLQKEKNFLNQNNNYLIKDFIFITQAIQHIYRTTQDNQSLQCMLKLYKFWEDFAILAINLLKTYGFQESDLKLIVDLNPNSVQSLLVLLQMLNPKYFLEIKPVKRELIFSDDSVGRAMMKHYYNRPTKTRIALQHVDLTTIAKMIIDFENYLRYVKPYNIPPQILFKAQLLQQRYIEESFVKHTDRDDLLSYYTKYAVIVEGTTNGRRCTPAVDWYYFKIAEFLARHYYAITRESIPPLEHLEDYMAPNSPKLSYC